MPQNNIHLMKIEFESILTQAREGGGLEVQQLRTYRITCRACPDYKDKASTHVEAEIRAARHAEKGAL